MRVLKMDTNIKTKVVDSRRGKILTNHYRVLERVNNMKCCKLKGWMATNNHIKIVVEDSRRDRSHSSLTDLARLGKTLCLKVKGNDCGKRRERRGTGSMKGTRRVITNPTETTKKKTQQTRLINEERKKKTKKKQSSDREHEKDQEGDHESNRNNQKEDSADEVDK